MPEEDIAEVMAQLLVEAAKQRPEALLGLEQAAAYIRIAERVVSPDLNLNHLRLGPTARILKHLLKLGLSVANSPVVIKHIVEGLAHGQQEGDIAEVLVPRLRPSTIEIEMKASYLRQLVEVELAEGQSVSVYDPQVDDKVREQFKMLAGGLFYEFGIRVPDIALVASARIKEQGFSIKLNPLGGIPRLGLRPDQLLVNATVAHLKTPEGNEQRMEKSGYLRVAGQVESLIHRLGLKTDHLPVSDKKSGITALEAINPANDTECSIIDKKDKQTVEDKGLYVWDPLGYLILSLAKELRRNAWRLLHLEAVEYELAQIHRDLPDLVLTTMENISLKHLTRILRELLSEEVTIRDLRAILELILTYDYIVTDPSKFIVFDDRLALSEQPQASCRDDARHYTQHVRTGLKRYLTHKLTRGQNTLVVYLLDVEIERRILDHLAVERGNKGKSALTTTQVEQILAAVRSEVSSLPPSAALPVILTISEIRAFVRQMVAPEFPNLFVASYDELSPESNIQPIARISLKGLAPLIVS